MLFLCMIPKSSSYPSRGFKKKKDLLSVVFFQEFVLLFFGVSSFLSSLSFLSLQCIMMVNISWLFRRNPQARHSAVSNGCFCFQITGSGSAADLFTKTASPLTTSRGRSQEYDSGNDTSSPPSMQISSTRSRSREGEPQWGPKQEPGPQQWKHLWFRELFHHFLTPEQGGHFGEPLPHQQGQRIKVSAPGWEEGFWLSSTISVSHPGTAPHTHTHTHTHTHEARRLLFVKEREISIIWGLGIKEISFRYSWIQGLKNVSLRSCLSHYFSQLCFPPLGFFLKQIILKHWQVCHPVNILSI